ncbi:heptaprenyl diphosphate synthase [Anaeroplasma bactoclasticum]|jgi:heptaprenyl diphosphate synthase|uniref:Heptaprenyl diphosphate synthase n=1 Tax=Anaeroplasma bactoclasticum TaxID=2088 RepID=A0A397QVS4_9MOLU|nr:Gx transporter family protein [Anaeroplasma bactoclasticum]RIA65026.1 heptaprenyl diphosphate synthase [Anaeroplasma bactoclasticum]
MNKDLKRWIVISMLMAMACVLSYLESFIPVFIPGVKLGLANVIILIMLYEFKFYEAGIVDLLRIIVVALIRGTIASPTFFMSLAGGILSYIVMLIFSKIKIFSPIGVSALGSISHFLGQIIVVIIIINLDAVLYYLPFIAVLSIITGVLSGFIARTYLNRSITKNVLGEIE